MTLYFLDTEFIEAGPAEPLKLLSIGLVCEDGREYYSVAADGWGMADVTPWLLYNVFPYLGGPWKKRDAIKNDILEFFSNAPNTGGIQKPELWGYFSAYDFVLLSQLWNRMIDLPKGMPKHCNDLRQEMGRLSVLKNELPKQEGTAHNALEDARWNRRVYQFLFSDNRW